MVVVHNVPDDEGTDREFHVQNTNLRKDEDRTHENDACRVGEFPVEKIVKDVKAGRRMKYKVCKKTLIGLENLCKESSLSFGGFYMYYN